MRRTSATLLADSGATTTQLQRHGGWKSAKVAGSYVAASKAGEKELATKLGATQTSPYFTRGI